MISVVIPTMWRAIEHLSRMLPILDDHPLIGEILLIDNDRSKTNHDLLKNIKKLTYWSFEEGNIYVNPAWNFGAKNAKYDKLFILNDDCVVNLTGLETIYDEINPNNGMIGFSFLSYCTYTLDAFETLRGNGFGEDISLEIIDPRAYPSRSGMPHPFYGSAYFIHRDSYHTIPDDFKIYYGDLYIYVSNLKNNIPNLVIEDGLVMTVYSSTVSALPILKILNHEANILKDVFAKHGLKNIKYEIKIPEKK